jgi:hypothetical protein
MHAEEARFRSTTCSLVHYQLLEFKACQLVNVPNGVHRGIFLGDAGCQLFNNIPIDAATGAAN